ncbi:MAG: AAA family ATPase [Dehalococcoidia bacterium]|nr:AAA family ATPase [Dehalococcoidia bacterium]
MPPYLPFVEVLRQYVHASSDEELQPIVSAAPEIAMLLPEIAGRFGPVSPGRLGPESERYALFQAVSEFFLHAANSTEARGLLICLDDLHWADRSTLLLFQHLARNMAAARLCLVGTYRTVGVDAGHPLFPILADLTRERLYQGITLAPFSPEETATLVAALTSRKAISPALIASVHDRTKGNPFFIEEVVRHLQVDGRDLDDPVLVSGQWGMPEGVRQVIGSRIARLSPEDRRLLQAAAILGDEFGQMFPVIARMLDVEVSALAETVEEAVSAGMLREDGESYRFAHALIRDALLDELPLPRRQRLHLSAARAMEDVYARNLEPRLSAIAVHCRLAGPFADGEKAIDYSIRAGEAAQEAFAYEEARVHWEAALDLMDRHGVENAVRVSLVERLGELMQVVGFDNYSKSARYFEEAIALHEKAGDNVAAAAMHARLALLLGAGGPVNDNPAALSHLQAAEPFLRDGPPGDARLSFYSALGLVAVWQVHTADGLADSGAAMEIAQQLGEEDRWVTNAVMHSYHLHAQGHLEEGLDLMQRAWETADRLNNTYRAFVAAMWLGGRLLGLGDPVKARAWFQREVDQPRQANAPSRRLMLHGGIAGSYARAGELDTCRQVVAATGASAGAELAFWDGRWDRLEPGWSNSAHTAAAGLNRSQQAAADGWLGRLRRLRGDMAGAINALSDALAIGLDGPSLLVQLEAGAELAIVLAETGRTAGAEPHLARCRDILDMGEDWRGLAGRVALAEAVTAGMAGCIEAGDAHFARAIATFQRFSLPFDEAEALTLRGQVHAHAGRHHRHAAAESFEKAVEIYSVHGAGQPWLDHVVALQHRALGGRNGALAAAYPDGLTEREVEVLRLLATGLSSKEIGDALVLSVRTVERHIANVYIKTGTHGRAQATAYALSHGLGSPDSLAR